MHITFVRINLHQLLRSLHTEAETFVRQINLDYVRFFASIACTLIGTDGEYGKSAR